MYHERLVIPSGTPMDRAILLARSRVIKVTPNECFGHIMEMSCGYLTILLAFHLLLKALVTSVLSIL